MRSLPVIAGLLFAALLPFAAAADDYIGAEQCAACHAEAYAWWKTTAHARAGDVLADDEKRDPRCTGCHATAQGKPHVQCEACHGPGKHYWPAFVMVDVHLARAAGLRSGAEAATCNGCHTGDAPGIRPFDLKTALEKMRSHVPPEAPAKAPAPAAAPTTPAKGEP